MADFDVIADTTPQLEYAPTRNYGRKTIDELKTELQAIDGTTYTNAEILKMTYNDLVYAIRAVDTGS
jgi:hypothetical protein